MNKYEVIYYLYSEDYTGRFFHEYVHASSVADARAKVYAKEGNDMHSVHVKLLERVA